MPTGTFFRLPEEKRSRLMEVAWEETYSSVTSAAASARSAIRSNKLALRVTRCQNRLFVQKEATDAE